MSACGRVDTLSQSRLFEIEQRHSYGIDSQFGDWRKAGKRCRSGLDQCLGQMSWLGSEYRVQNSDRCQRNFKLRKLRAPLELFLFLLSARSAENETCLRLLMRDTDDEEALNCICRQKIA